MFNSESEQWLCNSFSRVAGNLILSLNVLQAPAPIIVIMDGEPGPSTHLTYANVGLAFSFILFDAVVSFFFGLGVGSSLITSAVRCVLQLAVVATLLQKVFEANNSWAVAGIACESQLKGWRPWSVKLRKSG